MDKTIYVRYRLLYFLRQYLCLNVFIFSIFRLDQLHSQYIIWLNYVGPNTWHYLHVLLFLIKLGVTETQRYNTSTLRHLFMLYFCDTSQIIFRMNDNLQCSKWLREKFEKVLTRIANPSFSMLIAYRYLRGDSVKKWWQLWKIS